MYDVNVSCHPKILVTPTFAHVVKNGLKCVTACGDCHGEGCNNSEEIMLEIEEETGNYNTDAGSIFNSYSLCVPANAPYN